MHRSIPRPAATILLPVRDAAATLPTCIDSIEAQTLRGWECIAVDDRSGDDSREILRAWAARDRRVTVSGAPPPGGIVAALEEARRLARSSLLARQDADDASAPERLERQVAVLREAGEGFAVLGCLTKPRGLPPSEGMRRYLDWLAECAGPNPHASAESCAREIWVESPIAHPTAVMRAAAVAQVGGYRDAGWPEDYDLWLRLHRAGYRLANLPERLYEWTDREERLSRRDPRYAPAAFLRCRVHHLRHWLSERGVAGARPLVIWGAGRDGRRLARAWEEEGTLPGPPAPGIAAFIDIDPRKIGRSRRGRPVLALEDALRAYPEAFYLVAVGVAGAREQIRGALAAAGQTEGRDFYCVH